LHLKIWLNDKLRLCLKLTKTVKIEGLEFPERCNANELSIEGDQTK